MVDIEILGERPVAMAEVREIIKEKKKDINFRETKSLDYINTFAKLKLKDVEEIKRGLEDLGISRLKERQVIKIIDIMPVDIDSLKLILTSEEITLKQDDLDKIIEVVRKHA